MSPLSRRRRDITQQVVVILPVVALLVAGWQARWMSDDGFIDVRVVQQVLGGNGLVFNAGERVEVSTSVLWVLLLGVVHVVTRIPLAEAAVVLGVLLSGFGLWAAQRAGLCLARVGTGAGAGPGTEEAEAEATAQAEAEPASVTGRLVLPIGAVVVAALPPFWDYASSGLETGLAFAWIGACCWLCAHRVGGRGGVGGLGGGRRALLGSAVVVGLGPLVRPDLAVFSVAFGSVLVLSVPTAGNRLRLGAALVALPAAYQVFRMGYYAQLVPNPAIAKSAARAQWGQGWIYLQDLVGTYWLLIPLLLLVGIVVRQCVDDLHERDRLWAAGRLAPIAAALVHGAYIVRLGGDFMHARLLLPALFAIAAPVGVAVRGSVGALSVAPTGSPQPRTRLSFVSRKALWAVPVGLLAVWAVVCALAFRPHLSSEEWRPSPISADGIGDEPAFYRLTWEREHPVSEADYPFEFEVPVPRAGYALLDLDGDGWADHGAELADGPSERAVSAASSIGAISVIWGNDVYVVDALGLANPIGSRVPPEPDSRIGHERWLPLAWQVAGLPSPISYGEATLNGTDLRAARQAVECGRLGRYLRDIRAPLTPGRFLGNVVDSFGNTFLRVPDDPDEAVEQFCDR